MYINSSLIKVHLIHRQWKHPQLSRSTYSDKAVTLIQPSVKNSYNTAIYCSVVKIMLCLASNAPKFNLLALFLKNFLGETCPPNPPYMERVPLSSNA